MTQEIIRRLGENLVLRRATHDDAENLLAFDGDVLRDPGQDEPDEHLVAWVRDLLERPHPTFRPGDFTLVEDTATGRIVSSLCLISQTWAYDGVEFPLGRPELVATHPDYRRRGLVRAQFDVIHGWSAERGEWVQAITGIPWFYRQFGYEMAMTLGGMRLGYKSQVPKLDDGQEEPYVIRPATESDLDFIARLYDRGCQRYPLSCVRDEAIWRHELKGKSEKNVNRRELAVVETPGGEPVGFLGHHYRPWRGRMGLTNYELKSGVSWPAVTPSVIRYLWARGEAGASLKPAHEMERFALMLGEHHPAYAAARRQLPHELKPYAWYLRVPDLPGFLRHLTPALDRRLGDSIAAGHTGELHVSFYRSGLRLVFEDGRLAEVTPWQPTVEKGGDAAFPDLTFLQLLFGYRTLEELDQTFPDCWLGSDDAWALLEALFPRASSDLWPLS
ncbi:MAG: GNAT family N-acetyltransferase [Anaerolineae bacterium]|jgi:hypothetical protein